MRTKDQFVNPKAKSRKGYTNEFLDTEDLVEEIIEPDKERICKIILQTR